MDPNDGDIFCRMNIVDGFYEIPTQQFWNQIIDARWQSIWKRKNPWYDEWGTYTVQQTSMSTEPLLSIHHPLSNRHSAHQLLLKQEVEQANDNVHILQCIHSASVPTECMASPSMVRRSLCEHHQARVRSARPY